MNILFLDWGAYTYADVSEAMRNLGIQFKTVSYCFGDKNEDDFFLHRFGKEIEQGEYDAVFSINYFPLVAKSCHHYQLPYISWSYDNPLNVPNMEDTLGYDTNFVFLFDKIQVQGYRNKGYENVYHMPLAVNCSRLDQIHLNEIEQQKYSCDVAFVGKLYDSDFGYIQSFMTEYQRGYMQAITTAQTELYGCYLVDQSLTDEYVEQVDQRYKQVTGNSAAQVTKEMLSYAISAEATRRERLLLLGILGKYTDVHLYSREDNELLKNVKFMGSCGYLNEMPRVFKGCKINLNNTLKCLQTGISLRVLDILGAGGFLLTNYQEEIFEYFVDGEDVVMYENAVDALEKARYYLQHEDERIQIAQNGYRKAKELFSYEERVKQMLEVVFGE